MKPTTSRFRVPIAMLSILVSVFLIRIILDLFGKN